jgi:hypothetical protein
MKNTYMLERPIFKTNRIGLAMQQHNGVPNFNGWLNSKMREIDLRMLRSGERQARTFVIGAVTMAGVTGFQIWLGQATPGDASLADLFLTGFCSAMATGLATLGLRGMASNARRRRELRMQYGRNFC